MYNYEKYNNQDYGLKTQDYVKILSKLNEEDNYSKLVELFKYLTFDKQYCYANKHYRTIYGTSGSYNIMLSGLVKYINNYFDKVIKLDRKTLGDETSS